MLKVTENLFFKIYFSNTRIVSEVYCLSDIAYLWHIPQEDTFVYIVSPKTERDYHSFLEKIEKKYPLLAELV